MFSSLLSCSKHVEKEAVNHIIKCDFNASAVDFKLLPFGFLVSFFEAGYLQQSLLILKKVKCMRKNHFSSV